MKVVSLLLLTSCIAPFQFIPPTPEAIGRRHAASKLRACWHGSSGTRDDLRACDAISATECALAGLKDNCGHVELYMQCITQGSAAQMPGMPDATSCPIPPPDEVELPRPRQDPNQT